MFASRTINDCKQLHLRKNLAMTPYEASLASTSCSRVSAAADHLSTAAPKVRHLKVPLDVGGSALTPEAPAIGAITIAWMCRCQAEDMTGVVSACPKTDKSYTDQ